MPYTPTASPLITQGYRNCVLTPNIAELGRLAKAVGVDTEGPMGVAWQVHLPDIARGAFVPATCIARLVQCTKRVLVA